MGIDNVEVLKGGQGYVPDPPSVFEANDVMSSTFKYFFEVGTPEAPKEEVYYASNLKNAKIQFKDMHGYEPGDPIRRENW